MNIRIEFLRKADRLRDLLREDGWSLTMDTARHPQIHDEQTARNRLQELGLLTASSVRIEFPFRGCGGAVPTSRDTFPKATASDH